MKGLFLLARDSELKEIICDIGGVEGFPSRYDRQIERVANYRHGKEEENNELYH